MRLRAAALPLLCLALAPLAAACGDDDSGGGSECGPGTVLMDGQCVPDGSVICETGTTYNADTGKCDPDISGCGEGTVLVDGECVPDDGTVEADLEEAPEPNDGFEQGDAIAGMLDLPDVGADGVVVHGCVTPYRDLDQNGNPDIDYDMWLVSTDGPALLEVTADGVGGLAAGFFLLPGEQQSLIDAGWQRFGLNLTGDTSKRQVYLPAGGIYALVMSDSRSLFLTDGAVGSEETCYYGTIAQVAVPAPIAANTEEAIAPALGNETQFYSFPATQGGLYDVVHDVDFTTPAALPSVVALINGDFAGYSEPFDFFFHFPAEVFLGGQHPTDEVIVVVEPVYNYSLEPVASSLFAHALPVVPLPVNGNTQAIDGTGPFFETFDNIQWAWFDVGADEVVHFDLTFSSNANLVFVTPDLSTISVPSFPPRQPGDGDPPIGGFNGWLRFPGPGRYYAALMQPGGNNFNATGAVTRVNPTLLEVGTPVTGAPFSDLEATWYSLDATGETWLAGNAGAAGFGGNVLVDLYDPTSFGQFDVDFDRIDGAAFNRNGSTTVGRIVYGTGSEALVRVSDAAGTAGAGATYDLSVAERDFSDLGAIDETNPASLPGEPIPAGAGAQARYFVRGAPGDTMTITVAPTGFNARIDVLGPTENVIATVNAGGAGAPETIEVPVNAETWIAFRVVRAGGTGTAFDLDVVATSPVPYDITEGSLNYANACAAGEDITPATAFERDEGLTPVATLPFDFDLFGGASGNDYQVSTNGWLAFGAVASPAFFNTGLPDSGVPNGMLAPYWDDIVVTSICRLEAANRVTIQWNGTLYDDDTVAVQFQAVIRENGRVDYIYGPGHEADGGSATGGTVGIENLGGTFGHQMVFNSAGQVSPDSSFTLTPQP